MNWSNELTRILKIKYPVVQAPMLGVTSPAMVAAISNAGGLGSLPVGGLSPEKTADLIQQTKTLTSNPFAVNLFAHAIPVADEQQLTRMRNYLAMLTASNNLGIEPPVDAPRFYSYTEQADIILDLQVPVVSFTFGVLNDETIRRFKEGNIVLAGTATTVKEAQYLEAKDIDIITAQGIEAGGHRGTFLPADSLPLIGSMSLIPQVAGNVSKPVLAAGGINSGRTIRAAFILGASGVQAGSVFIASTESMATPSHKLAIQQAEATDTVLTKAFSGRWARAIKNKYITAVEASGITIPDYPLMTALTTSIRAAAQKQNNKEFTALWAGQSANHSKEMPAAVIFRKLIEQAEEQV